MSSEILTNPEQWCDNYEAASPQEQYSLMMAALEEQLKSELIEQLDLGMLLVELIDELDSNNLLTDALELIEKVQQNHPEFYAQEFQYLDTLRVKYYLFHNQPELVRSCLTQFKANPIRSIDQMMGVIDYLQYYGANDILVDLCNSIYIEVKKSSEIIRGTEDDLAGIILLDLLEKAYHKLQKGETADWESIADAVNQFDPENAQKWLSETRQILTEKIEVNELFFAGFKKQEQRSFNLRALSMAFADYMAVRKQVGFISSLAIWSAVFRFLADRELSNKELEHPERYFSFTEKQLDEYLASLLKAFFSDRKSEVFAVLWGIPYIYELLHQQKVISEKVYETAIAGATALKPQIINYYGKQLWKFDFVHRWSPPDSISDSDFEKEASIFATSINQFTPLSTEPGEGSLESFYNQIKENSPFKDLFTEQELEEQKVANPPKQADVPQFKPLKPPKKRKSPLMQAAELIDQNKLPKSKQKKKK